MPQPRRTGATEAYRRTKRVLRTTSATMTETKPRCNRLPYIAGTLAVTVLILCLASAAFWFEKQRHLERASIATQNIVELLEENVVSSIQKIDVALGAARLFYESRSQPEPPGTTRLSNYLENLGALSPALGNIRIVDKDGVVRYGEGISVNPPVSLRDFDFFEQTRLAARADLVVHGPVLSPLNHQWVMIFSRRLSTPDGSFAGAIYASVETRLFQDILSSVSLGAHGAATLRSADLALIHRVPETKNTVGSKTVSTELRQVIEKQPKGGAYIAPTAIDGIERINAYRKVAEHPVYLIVGLATQDYLGHWQKNVMVIAGLAVLAVLVTAMAAYRNYRAQLRLSQNFDELARMGDNLRQSLEERRALNEQLILRAREAEAASIAKSAFLANMSHEMRTPLNHIQGMAVLIQRDSLAPKQTERMEKLMHACRHLTQLVVAVLDFTRLDAETMEENQETFDLTALVQSAVAEIQLAASGKGLLLKIEPASGIGVLFGDAGHIRRALQNYLSNALRHTQAGSITIRTIPLESDDQSVLIRFEVEDTGEGIREEHLPRLFAIFEQVDNSSTREVSGLGIGLALTKKIAKALGGDAGCHSRLGAGSTFWFTVRLISKGSDAL